MLLKNARLASGQPVDLLLKDGLIAAIGLDLAADGEEVLDCAGRTVLPAFVDLHCHWRTPGFEYKEDIATGSAAAAAGGYTFVNLMPNTKPVCSSADIAHSVMAEAERIGLCAANQTVSITQNFDGHTLDHLKTLPEDLKFITEDGKGVQSGNVMAKAFAIAAQRGLTIMSHAEDMDISPWDYRLAENIETVRNLHLSEYYGTRLHMCHVSTKEAVEAIGAAKWKGVPVTCEVTPHHLWFADTDYRVNPPIRKAEDVDALIEAIRLGVVDAIATDHAPPHRRGKGRRGRGHGGPGDRLRCVLHQTVQGKGPAPGPAGGADEHRPRRDPGPCRPRPGAARLCGGPDPGGAGHSLHRGQKRPPLQEPQLPLRRRAALRPGGPDHQRRQSHLETVNTKRYIQFI